MTAGDFPAVGTLDDVAAMNAAGRHGHRFELSPAGALPVMPPADSGHAAIAGRIFARLRQTKPTDHQLGGFDHPA